VPTPGDVLIELDPGMAFGTGLHQTTRMSLALLERLVQPGWLVIDQGTGSGILAVAAARLGASSVLARDITEVAVLVAVQNARLNTVDEIVLVERVNPHAAPTAQVLLSPDQPKADLILANIVATVLVHLAEAFAAASRAGAWLIASGIIKDRAEEVRLAFEQAGYEVRERLEEDEWVTLLARLVDSPATASS
jgi:ribosomal protein L11 methyltransferase